jgi:hypothetical protein
MPKHNKKRNIGIIYEQLLQTLSSAVINKDRDQIKVIKEILSSNFKPGTHLYREFRLFNALVNTTVPSDSLASRILDEAKRGAIKFDLKQLNLEKSKLIKSINYKLNDPKFYSQRVDEYRSYATVQTLLDDWRRGEKANMTKLVEYELKVHSMLISDKQANNLSEKVDPEVNKITVKIMLEKFNKKYGSTLNSEQMNIVKDYIFNSDSQIIPKLKEVKENTLKELNFLKKTCDNKILVGKVDKVYESVVELDENIISDDNMSRFMLVSRLKEEILEDKKNEQ